jgi:hypothetical protein
MKSLAEIEPRQPVSALAGDASAAHIISEPGSYFLDGNLDMASKPIGIEIRGSHVTLDLMGFVIERTGVPGGTGVAITVDDLTGITIRNGTFSGLGDAIESTAGADPINVVVRRVTVENCTGKGIDLGEEPTARVESCFVTNTSKNGINAGTVLNCMVSQCSDTAIRAGATVINSWGENNNLGGSGIICEGDVLNSYGSCLTGNGISAAGDVRGSTGKTTNSFGTNVDGISADGSVHNSTGESASGVGIYAMGSVYNSTGISTGTGTADHGIEAEVSVIGSTGNAAEGSGIKAGKNVASSSGEGGLKGIDSTYAVMNSHGDGFNDDGIDAVSIVNSVGNSEKANGILGRNVAHCQGTGTISGIAGRTVLNSYGQGQSDSAIGISARGIVGSFGDVSSSGGTALFADLVVHSFATRVSSGQAVTADIGIGVLVEFGNTSITHEYNMP